MDTFSNSLPTHESLPVGILSRCFDNTDKSYKFYWFLSILDHIQDSPEALHISYEELFTRMVSNVWYPLDFYKLSFGKNDAFKKVAEYLSGRIEIDHRVNARPLFEQINEGLQQEEYREMYRMMYAILKANVPYRFQSPFFSAELKGIKDHRKNKKIQELAGQYYGIGYGKVFYRYTERGIELDGAWKEYFLQHQPILRGFIFWHLLNYVQKHNPNVVGLVHKLEKRKSRDLKLARSFWDIYLQHRESAKCIYSGEEIVIPYSIDHFIPWSYVVHDQLWNLTPISASVNSSKSNALPSLEKYLESFQVQQYDAFQTVVRAHIKKDTKQKIMEDYLQLFECSEGELLNIPHHQFASKLGDKVKMNEQMAGSMGFERGWRLGLNR
ncbi:HNH endonuclease domain-containing protein [Algivirga pacifica]|uniref:HNH endonuclease domain-containing protein n=1 Tax=Algivirga pacifica TaxID=1162670 RepID=A0ABP9DMK3_9BACT